MLFAFLDDYLANASKDKRLYEQLSEYAALNEVFFAVRLHRPGPGERLSTRQLIKLSTSKAFKFQKSSVKDALILAKLGNNLGLVDPFADFLDAYDSQARNGKRADPLRLRRFDAIQEAQDLFWKTRCNVEREVMRISDVP
jgi:hypothetical protein